MNIGFERDPWDVLDKDFWGAFGINTESLRNRAMHLTEDEAKNGCEKLIGMPSRWRQQPIVSLQQICCGGAISL